MYCVHNCNHPVETWEEHEKRRNPNLNESKWKVPRSPVDGECKTRHLYLLYCFFTDKWGVVFNRGLIAGTKHAFYEWTTFLSNILPIRILLYAVYLIWKIFCLILFFLFISCLVHRSVISSSHATTTNWNINIRISNHRNSPLVHSLNRTI